ncbi:MAG TPA: aldehyde ferredoxin oxidoreductase family protein [Chloroflexi bacterium]|jgi:aldehyde:ferredoxin oxidoreductase|nr:aldehyde ferredoxin oxidoreductase family protein [Chloroflexota bacterium]
MANGFAGKILWVNLTDGKIWTEEPDDAFYRRYMGGNGFVGHYLLKEVPKGADPLGPDNVLIFATGAITGHPIAGSGRSCVGGKSPLTGGYGQADVGGFFGAELKHAGYDAVIVKGASEKPVYLWIHDGEAELRSAEHLWGTSTLDCQNAIQSELNDRRVRLAMIGPAGEKLVRFACVINDLRHAAGRTGLGAVMGSKNLKAVAARGRATIPVADNDKFREFAHWMRDNWKQDHWGTHDLGTNGGLKNLSEIGALPTRNFQDGQFEGADKITGTTMRDTVLTGREGCYACPVRCKRVVEIHDEEYDVNPIYGGAEYETVGAVGSNCGIDDLRPISKAHELCNAYGLDTISAGMMVSYAMECYEAGLLSKEDTGGLDLRFGNGPAMVELIRQIGEREGLGDILAEGPRGAVAHIGRESAMFSVDVKGQPFPMHECRVRHAQGLGYAVSPTGADHMHNFWDEGLAADPPGDDIQTFGVYKSVPRTELNTDKVRAYAYASNWQWVHNHLGHCMFIKWSRDQMVDLVRAITGWKVTFWELLRVGERGVTMARAFNMREGLGRKDDVLPLRMNTPHKSGTLNEAPIDPEVLDEAVTTFYGIMGWDPETGEPTLGKLQDLDLEWVVESMK